MMNLANGETGMSASDWIALYGAFLSTALAVAAFWAWLRDGPSALVSVFNPNEYWTGQGLFGFVISNSGKRPFVVSELKVTFLTAPGRRSGKVGEAIFNQNSRMNPSSMTVPHPHKPNTVTQEPRVVGVGEEYHASAKPVSDYDPEKHWIKVVATVRGSTKRFSGWASPVPRETPHA